MSFGLDLILKPNERSLYTPYLLFQRMFLHVWKSLGIGAIKEKWAQ
jgi:hypothetical protein